MIHGYNTAENEGVDDMNALRALLASAYPPLAREVLTSTWPGHAPGKLGRLAYPRMVPNARGSARPLLRKLYESCTAPPANELVLVAHSLGCRVALEILRRWVCMARPAQLTRLTLVLMAAAVPVPMVRAGGRLARGLSAADRILVLHSKSDRALGIVFRIGQALAGEGRSRAVGRRGEDFPRDQRQDMSPMGHNDYWRSPEVAEAICRAAGVPASASARSRPMRMAPPLHLPPLVLAPLIPIY